MCTHTKDIHPATKKNKLHIAILNKKAKYPSLTKTKKVNTMSTFLYTCLVQEVFKMKVENMQIKVKENLPITRMSVS